MPVRQRDDVDRAPARGGSERDGAARRLTRCWCLLAAGLAAGACAGPAMPDLNGLYDRAASDHSSEQRNPIVVIPGILGSKLVVGGTESEEVVWGAFTGRSADPETPAGARLIALPMRPGVPLADLRDDVVPDGVLTEVEVELLGLPVLLEAYRSILLTLGVGGYRDESLGLSGAVDYGDEHFTCFQFDYDWRRDLGENAARLAGFLERKREEVEQELDRRGIARRGPVQFDVVAHSMGGVLLRYYLRYGADEPPASGVVPWTGAAGIGRAILVGTPNAGSANALVQLVEGVQFGPFTPHYDAAVLGTWPAAYQILPRGRHDVLLESGRPVTDLLDPALWQRMGWGLSGPDDEVLAWLLPDVADAAARRAIAVDHLAQCLARARVVTEALDRPADPPPGLELYLFAGDAVPTVAVLSARGRELDVVSRRPGDGTVLRSSALLDERTPASWTPRLVSPVRWRQVQFLFEDHLGLTRDPNFTDNVLYLLLEDPRVELVAGP